MQGSVMITAPTPAPAMSAGANLSDYRNRPSVAERTILPDSTPKASDGLALSDNDPQEPASTPSAPVDHDSSAMFAAALISGALSPTPKTLDELMMRIGTSTIPEGLEARLKDFVA
jgi:hypothetical protein